MVGDLENVLVHRHQRHLALRFPDLPGQLFLDPDHLAGVSMRELHRLDEIFLGHFVRRAFDHDHIVFRAHINEVEITLITLVMGRVGDELPVHPADADGADGPGKWNVGNGQRGRRAVDGENVRIVLAVRTEENRSNLGVVKVTGGK